MTWEIRIHPKAIKELGDIDKRNRYRIKEKMSELSNSFGKKDLGLDIKPVAGAKRGVKLYRLRVGDYRVIFEVTKNVLWIARISHRSEVYKGL